MLGVRGPVRVLRGRSAGLVRNRDASSARDVPWGLGVDLHRFQPGRGEQGHDVLVFLGGEQLGNQGQSDRFQQGPLRILDLEVPLPQREPGRHGGHPEPGHLQDQVGKLPQLCRGGLVAQQHDLRHPPFRVRPGRARLMQVVRAKVRQGPAGIGGLAAQADQQLLEVLVVADAAGAQGFGQSCGNADEADLQLLRPGGRTEFDGERVEDLVRPLGISVDAQGSEVFEVQQQVRRVGVLADGDQCGIGGEGMRSRSGSSWGLSSHTVPSVSARVKGAGRSAGSAR